MHRMGLIQTPQQLRFCWKTIADWLSKRKSTDKSTSTETVGHSGSKLKDVNCDDETLAAPIGLDPKKGSTNKSPRKRSSIEPETSTLISKTPPPLYAQKDAKPVSHKSLSPEQQKRKETIQKMKKKIADTEGRIDAGLFGRLLLRIENNGICLKRLALMGGGSATVIVVALLYYYLHSTDAQSMLEL